MASGNVKGRVSVRHLSVPIMELTKNHFELVERQRETIVAEESGKTAAPAATLNGKPIAYDAYGLPILSPKEEKWEYVDGEFIDVLQTRELYALQEELEHEQDYRDAARQKKRELSRGRGYKNKISFAVGNFYSLLQASLKPSVLQNEERFNRFLVRTRNLDGLLNERQDVLLEGSRYAAELIFVRQQKIEGKDEKTQKRFSMLVSNFINYCPGIQHYLNVFAQRQAAYEQALEYVSNVLSQSLKPEVLRRERLGGLEKCIDCLNVVNLHHNFRELITTQRSTRASMDIAELLLAAENSLKGQLWYTQTEKVTIWRGNIGIASYQSGESKFEYLKSLASTSEVDRALNSLEARKPEMNGEKHYQPFVNRQIHSQHNGHNDYAEIPFNSQNARIATPVSFQPNAPPILLSQSKARIMSAALAATRSYFL